MRILVTALMISEARQAANGPSTSDRLPIDGVIDSAAKRRLAMTAFESHELIGVAIPALMVIAVMVAVWAIVRQPTER
jgi:hypothetical protein